MSSKKVENKISKKKLFMVLIDGPMGAGKTTTSRLLNKKLEGTARVPLDEIKKYISGFRTNPACKKISREIQMIMVEAYLKRGISVIIEWAMKQEHIENFIKIAKRNKARFFIYQLNAPKHLLIKRVKERTRMLKGRSRLTKESVEKIDKKFEKNYNFHFKNRYNEAIVFDSKKLSSEQIVKNILKEIKQ